MRVTIHAGVDGRVSPDGLAYVDVEHPEMAMREVAQLLRGLADEIEADGRFYELALRPCEEG